MSGNHNCNGEKSKPLGIYGKLQAMPGNKGLQRKVKKILSVQELHFIARRFERFALQEVARSILFQMVERKGKMTYVHQVHNCLRAKISKSDGVKVYYNLDRDTANYGNLQRCYSVWNCPICSATISEGRRLELRQGLDNWLEQGGYVCLVTFTNSHHRGDNLQQLLDGQKKAFKKLWERRKTKDTLKKMGYVGRIVATEVTWGEKNGWHPHSHILMFFDKPIDEKELQKFLAVEWQLMCQKSGLKLPDLIHGVDVQDGTYASQYVGKWGLEDEITKGHTKKGREGSLTPWDFLRYHEEHPEYGKLFKEFADVFKGKQQLVWSKGLKELLSIDKVTDAEIVETTEKASIELRELSDELWKLILIYKERAKVLQLAEYDYMYGTNELDNFIMELAKRYVDDTIYDVETLTKA